MTFTFTRYTTLGGALRLRDFPSPFYFTYVTLKRLSAGDYDIRSVALVGTLRILTFTLTVTFFVVG